MFLKIVLPTVSTGLLVFAVYHVANTRETWDLQSPQQQPVRSPYVSSVAGAGVIEAETENIEIGSPVPGVVAEVLVQVGQRLKIDAPLFRLDDRAMKAELVSREANLSAAQAELDRMKNLPRLEQVAVNEAEVKEAQSIADRRKYEYDRLKKLFEENKASEMESVEAEHEYHSAQARLARAQAELKLLNAGAWKYDLAVAEAAVTQAKAQVEQTRTELDRLIVRAPMDCQVLQVNVRPGVFVAAPPVKPLVVLGSLDQLHVRVDIDEYDIPRFNSQAAAQAALRGVGRQVLPLRFVRVEPFVIPKRSLTGENIERVDTRVLQVIYEIDTQGHDLFVGQQVDVFIDAANPSSQETSTQP